MSNCVDNILPTLPPAQKTKTNKQKNEKKKTEKKKEKKEKEKNPLYSVVQDVGLGQQTEKTYRLRRQEETRDRN